MLLAVSLVAALVAAALGVADVVSSGRHGPSPASLHAGPGPARAGPPGRCGPLGAPGGTSGTGSGGSGRFIAGISPGAVTEHLSRPVLRCQFAAMRAAGATAVRLDVFWPDAEKARGRYNFSAFDPEMELARRSGLRVLVVMSYPVSWSRGRARPADYAAFATRVVARYSVLGIHDFEIWNEPNLGANWWGGAADPVLYTTLLKAASAAIRATDPGATLVAGALANASTGGGDLDPVRFLDSMYSHGARGAFDILSDHPYSFPDLPSLSGDNGFAQALALHRAVLAAHDHVSQWLDEYGAPTDADGVNLSAQAEEIDRAFALSRAAAWISALFVYEWQDNPYGAGFGLLSSDGRPKPAYDAFIRGGRSVASLAR